MIKVDRLEKALAHMSDKALIRLVKRCICKAMMGVSNIEPDSRLALDMAYVECSRRGKERLYDSAYASISRHPERCDIY